MTGQRADGLHGTSMPEATIVALVPWAKALSFLRFTLGWSYADPPPESEDGPKVARDSGTLFERMSNIARGAAQAQGEGDEPMPSIRREPLDIPRFLNRQSNQ